MTIETGALEQCYAKVETSYSVVAADALAGSDGIRAIQLALGSKKNREASPEKRGTPDHYQSLPGRQASQWNLSEIMWEPSAALGTASDVGKFIKAAFGSSHVLSLATTVSASPTPTTTGCTLTSAAGVAVGDLIVFTMTGGTRQVTSIKSVVGAAITYDVLTAAPPAGGAAVVGVTYKLTNTITESLALYKYYNGGGFKQAVYGAVVDQLQIMFDGTKAVKLAMQGPAGDYGDTSGGAAVQAKPATHVTVGAPASGMVGGFWVDGAAFAVTAVEASLNNQLVLRNKDLGTSKASGIGGRNNIRDVNLKITFFMEDTNLLGKANTVVKGVLRCLVGDTNGAMVAMVCPSVEFEIPDVGSEIGLKELTVNAIAYAVSGNDKIILGEL